MKKIIAMLVLVVIAGAVLVGMTAKDNPEEISVEQVPAVENGHIVMQDIIIE